MKIFDENSIEKLNFIMIFGKFVTKNRAFGNNTIFLQQFFRLRGREYSPLPPTLNPQVLLVCLKIRVCAAEWHLINYLVLKDLRVWLASDCLHNIRSRHFRKGSYLSNVASQDLLQRKLMKHSHWRSISGKWHLKGQRPFQ